RNGIRVHLGEGAEAQALDGTHLLVATGRKPDLDTLDLDKAGIRHDESGIAISDRLRTSNRRVYAIGDVVGGPQFTHVANYHAGLVIRAILFRLPAREDRRLIPIAVHTDPQIARIGMSEAEAVA